MVFSSPVFLFVFLPLTLLLYYASPRILKNAFLFLASFLFYAWGEVDYAYLMILSILINYFFALAIQASSNTLSKALLTAAVILNLTPLFYFKYFNFVKSSLNLTYGINIALPLGISFFTFHALSYIIDVYRKKSSAQKNLINLGLYITNFPQLVAGPIVRYPEIEHQLTDRTVTLESFSYGIKRFVIGLSKKVLIANTLASVADPVFLMNHDKISFGLAWLALLCYALQIYFDFSGYSDMAIGLGRMFGFNFPENFNYPYIARSIKDFWRRWHISLSNWFRDYLYIPLGGSHEGKSKTYFNLLFVFFLCGLWHGANWTFVIWGLWHGAFLILERFSFGKFLSKLSPVIRHLYALSVILIGWVFFRSETLMDATNYLKILLGLANREVSYAFPTFPDSEIVLALLFGIAGSTPVVSYLLKLKILANTEAVEYLKIACIILLFTISAMALTSGTYNPFIYFRF